jgi:hypothetical protein
VAAESKTAILNIRIKPSVKDAAGARAAADRRSLAAYIELLIERDVASAGAVAPSPRKAPAKGKR